jgi:hypothetical protein
MIGSTTIRSGLLGIALTCTCVGVASGPVRAVSPHALAPSPRPIVLASERQMIQCTNRCDRDLRRCGRSASCRSEHTACIRECI